MTLGSFMDTGIGALLNPCSGPSAKHRVWMTLYLPTVPLVINLHRSKTTQYALKLTLFYLRTQFHRLDRGEFRKDEALHLQIKMWSPALRFRRLNDASLSHMALL